MAVRSCGSAGSNPAQEAGLKLFPFGEAYFHKTSDHPENGQTVMTQNVLSFDGTFHCCLEYSEYPVTEYVAHP